MKYNLKINEKEVRERHRSFWNNDSLGTPLIFATAKKENYTEKLWKSELSRKELDLCPNWHINRIENYIYGTEFLADAMPIASIMVGLDITNTAVLAGGDYDYGKYGDRIEYFNGKFDIENIIDPFNKDHFLTKKLKHCYENVINKVKMDACVNTPMTLDALSSLYHLHGAENILKDMIKRPEIIKKRTRELTETYLDFYDYFYRYLSEKGYGESSSWLGVFAEGKFESVRCDFTVMISNDMFKEFALEPLTHVCEKMDYSLFNMSSVKHIRFIEELSSIDSLNGIFWNPEPWLSCIPNYIEELKYIKKKGMCLEIACYTVEDAEFAARELGPDGLYIYMVERFNTTSDAQQAIEKIKKACK